LHVAESETRMSGERPMGWHCCRLSAGEGNLEMRDSKRTKRARLGLGFDAPHRLSFRWGHGLCPENPASSQSGGTVAVGKPPGGQGQSPNETTRECQTGQAGTSTPRNESTASRHKIGTSQAPLAHLVTSSRQPHAMFLPSSCGLCCAPRHRNCHVRPLTGTTLRI
jgi:hypothetical protein